MNLQEFLGKIKDELRLRNYSPRTVESYLACLNEYFKVAKIIKREPDIPVIKKYLLGKFKHEESKLENFWDINPIRIIMNVDHPLKVSGYEPALILHFQEFIKKQILL